MGLMAKVELAYQYDKRSLSGVLAQLQLVGAELARRHDALQRACQTKDADCQTHDENCPTYAEDPKIRDIHMTDQYYAKAANLYACLPPKVRQKCYD